MKAGTVIAIVGGVLAVAILLVAIGIFATRSNKTTVDATASPAAARGASRTTPSSAPTASGQLTLAGISGAVKVGDGAKLDLQYTGNAAEVTNTVLALNGAPTQAPTGFVGQFNIETPAPGSMAVQASVKLKDGTVVQSNTISITVADGPAAPTTTELVASPPSSRYVPKPVDSCSLPCFRLKDEGVLRGGSNRESENKQALHPGDAIQVQCRAIGGTTGLGNNYWVYSRSPGGWVAEALVDIPNPGIIPECELGRGDAYPPPWGSGEPAHD